MLKNSYLSVYIYIDSCRTSECPGRVKRDARCAINTNTFKAEVRGVKLTSSYAQKYL